MIIETIRTPKITARNDDLFNVLDRCIENFGNEQILVITSKIVSICEGRIVEIGKEEKLDLIRSEADTYLPPEQSKFNISLTIKNDLLIPTAGIDESNGNGFYVLWPEDPQRSANEIRAYLCERFEIENPGVIVTDSKTSPLRWGTTGVSIAHSGFLGLYDYAGAPDLFGRELKVTKSNVVDGLAAAAVVAMGEGSEQTPLARISDVGFVEFQNRNPSPEELLPFHYSIEDDLYAPLLQGVEWVKCRQT